MVQIDVDFEVFKELTAQRKAESDSYNAVIRRILGLDAESDYAINRLIGGKGVWFNGVNFPDGTQFRATYKGRTFLASIENGHWVDSDGNIRTSPSEAAARITSTNINGWRFWHALLPASGQWVRLDDLRK